MRKNKARILVVVLTLSVITSPFQSLASNKQEAEEKKQEMQENMDNVESEIEEMEGEISSIEEFVQSLDIQLSDLSTQLATLNVQMENKQGEIEVTTEELEVAKADEEKQYEDMKKRIRYMYENGNGVLIEMLFQTDNINDFLNKVEYVTKISEYDRNMLVKYQETKEQIIGLEVRLQEELVALATTQTEIEASKAEVEVAVATKNLEIENYRTNISEAEATRLTYANEMAIQERILSQIKIQEEKEAAEQAERESESRVAAEEAERKAAELAVQQNKPADNTSEEPAEIVLPPSVSNGGTGLVWPAASYNVSSEFGDREAPLEGASNFHGGIDIAGPSGTPIYAAAAGVVIDTGYEPTMGNYIIISHAGGMQTVYMHASYIEDAVVVGASVSQGQIIAGIGTTGLSTGDHLHFEVRINGVKQNPRNYL